MRKITKVIGGPAIKIIKEPQDEDEDVIIQPLGKCQAIQSNDSFHTKSGFGKSDNPYR